MKPQPLVSGLFVLGLSLAPLHAQLPPATDRAAQRYLERVAAADKARADAYDRVETAYQNEIRQAEAELRQVFEAAIRAAALRNQTEEVRNLTLRLESIVNPDAVRLPDTQPARPVFPAPAPAAQPVSAAQPAFSAPQPPVPGSGMSGTSFNHLVGVWESANSQGALLRRFEFRLPRTVVFTQTFPMAGGGTSTHTSEWRAVLQTDKIVIEPKQTRTSASSSRTWFEISIPFNVNSLEITRIYQNEGYNRSTESFRLTRVK